MNQGRIWTVVNPSVGLPLFLGAVAGTSLLVHTAVLSNTTWMADFFNGGSSAAKTAQIEQPVAVAKANAAFTVDVKPVADQTAAAFTVTVTPKAAAPVEMASLN